MIETRFEFSDTAVVVGEYSIAEIRYRRHFKRLYGLDKESNTSDSKLKLISTSQLKRQMSWTEERINSTLYVALQLACDSTMATSLVSIGSW